MPKTKYIVVDHFRGSDFVIFVFPEHVTHSDFAQSLGVHRNEILSAGFCCVGSEKDHFRCYGESVSLKKKARPVEDSDLLYRLFEDVY